MKEKLSPAIAAKNVYATTLIFEIIEVVYAIAVVVVGGEVERVVFFTEVRDVVEVVKVVVDEVDGTTVLCMVVVKTCKKKRINVK